MKIELFVACGEMGFCTLEEIRSSPPRYSEKKKCDQKCDHLRLLQEAVINSFG